MYMQETMEVDISNEVRAIILAVLEMENNNDSHGAISLASLLIGDDSPKTRDYCLYKYSYFGILDELTFDYVHQTINLCLGQKWLSRLLLSDHRKVIVTTKRGENLLLSSEKIVAIYPVGKKFKHDEEMSPSFYNKWENELAKKIAKNIKNMK